MTQSDVCRVIAAEAASEGRDVRASVGANVWHHFAHEILLVLDVAGDSPARRDCAVVPALRIDRVHTEELQLAMLELVLHGGDHAAIFKLEEAAAGCGEDERG